MTNAESVTTRSKSPSIDIINRLVDPRRPTRRLSPASYAPVLVYTAFISTPIAVIDVTIITDAVVVSTDSSITIIDDLAVNDVTDDTETSSYTNALNDAAEVLEVRSRVSSDGIYSYAYSGYTVVSVCLGRVILGKFGLVNSYNSIIHCHYGHFPVIAVLLCCSFRDIRLR